MLEIYTNSDRIRTMFPDTGRHIVCAEQAIINSAGSLARLGLELDKIPLHPDFEGAAKELRADIEQQAVAKPWRFSGPVDAAIRDMCLRSFTTPDAAMDLLRDDDLSFVGPLFYFDQDAEALRLTHELTVYLEPSK